MLAGNKNQFALGTLLLFTWIAAVIACATRYGTIGFAVGYGLSLYSWYVAARTRSPSFWPISIRPITLTELATLIAIGVILTGLTLPAVQSGPHPRRPAPAPASPAVIQE